MTGKIDDTTTFKEGDIGKPSRIAENFAIFDFELTPGEIQSIDALDTGARGGPDPDSLDLATYGFAIPD